MYAPRVQTEGAFTKIMRNLRETCEATVAWLLRGPSQLVLTRTDTQDDQGDQFMYKLIAGDIEPRICVHICNRLRPADLPQLIGRFDEAIGCNERMFFTDYVTDNLAERLRAQHIWFADAQGNAFLEIPGKLLIHTVGNRPARMPTPTGQHFSVPGSKVLHFLLKRGPSIQATYRGIREAIGVSIDKIGKLIRELEKNGVLQARGTGEYEILVPDRLLQLWVDAYDGKLKSALFLGRYAYPANLDFDFLIQEAARALPGQVVVAGEVAADALTQHLRPEILRLYIPAARTGDIRSNLRLAPSEQGTIELCDLYSPDIAGKQSLNSAAIADPALVYAELMADGDSRLADTAMRLRQEHLAWTL